MASTRSITNGCAVLVEYLLVVSKCIVRSPFWFQRRKGRKEYNRMCERDRQHRCERDRQDREQQQRKNREEAEKKYTPRRLPQVRERALSIMSQCHPEEDTGRPVSNQVQSPFFVKLPLEIRQRIYECVFSNGSSNRVLHILPPTLDRPLGYKRCFLESDWVVGWDHPCCGDYRATYGAFSRPHIDDSQIQGLLSLAKTCRQL